MGWTFKFGSIGTTKKAIIMQEKTYTEAELVSFGNFMLQSDRKGIRPRVRRIVNDVDLDKWKVKG